MMRKKIQIIIPILTTLVLLVSLVSAQLQLYIPVGEFKIESLRAIPQKGGGANLIFTVTNEGEQAGFNSYANCNTGGGSDNFEATLETGESKEIVISVPGGGCNEIVKCKIIVEDFSEDIEKKIDFINDCSLCGTEYETCSFGSTFCSGNLIKGCNQYCTVAEIIEVCQDDCIFYKGKSLCREDTDNWFVRNNVDVWPYVFYFIIILIIMGFGLLIYKITKRSKKDHK